MWVCFVFVCAPSFPTTRFPSPSPLPHTNQPHHHTQQGEKLDGASLDYLSQLFDSYSATFDASLHALEYKAPELLRRCVCKGYSGCDISVHMNLPCVCCLSSCDGVCVRVYV